MDATLKLRNRRPQLHLDSTPLFTTTMATLKPPSTQPRSSSTPTGPPKAPVKADATATIADAVVFQGTYPVTIGASTVIHPRARFYTYEGPIVVGDGCIISEKAVIGAAPDTSSTSSSRRASPATSTAGTPTPEAQAERGHGITTRLSYFVTIGPQSTILPGAHIHSSATIEALATIHRHADIGSHAKVCAGCEVRESHSIGEWVVVWGSGLGQQRKRSRDPKTPGPAVVTAAQVGQAPAGKVIEDARLMVLQKEREVLARMLVPAGPARKK
ncbi:hypothetical protein N7492_002222 [Penicillium capsulatum]|uniref:Dynactin subunit 6 n=1 Tax=Penicillium capsulatum TaxID=69766 RepID=A0A9W9IJQ7_9EURO|nr:hypothetical protein N7492_002222 [Penicillium capsulatum]KAJ6123171.1 hypothetical protein N7512_005636 [Penicillium capsulatum]